MSTVIDQSAYLIPALLDFQFPLTQPNTPTQHHQSTPSFDSTTSVSAASPFDHLSAPPAADTILDLEKQQHHHLQQFLYYQSLAIQKQELALKQQKEFDDLVNSFGTTTNDLVDSCTASVDPFFLATPANELLFEDQNLSVPALSPSPSSPRSVSSSSESSPMASPAYGNNRTSMSAGQPMYTFDGANNQVIPSPQDRLNVPYIPQSFSGLSQNGNNGMYVGGNSEGYQLAHGMGIPTPRQSFDSESYSSSLLPQSQSGLVKGPYVPSTPHQNLAYQPSYPPYHQPIPIAQPRQYIQSNGLPINMGQSVYAEVAQMPQQQQQWIPAAQSFVQGMGMGRASVASQGQQVAVKMESVSPKSTDLAPVGGGHGDDSDSETEGASTLPHNLSRSSTSSKPKPKTVKYRLKGDSVGAVASAVVGDGQGEGELDLSNVVLNPLGGGRGYVPGQTPDDPKKRHKCDVCGRGFARLFNLKSHQQTHDPLRPKPHYCPHESCGRTFSRLHDLERHRQGIHSDGPLMVAKRHGISPSVARAQTRIAQRAERGALV